MQPWAILGRLNSRKQEKAARLGGSELVNNADVVFDVLHAPAQDLVLVGHVLNGLGQTVQGRSVIINLLSSRELLDLICVANEHWPGRSPRESLGISP